MLPALISDALLLMCLQERPVLLSLGKLSGVLDAVTNGHPHLNNTSKNPIYTNRLLRRPRRGRGICDQEVPSASSG